MEKRILYHKSDVETEPLKRKILIHMAMYYQCECCNKVYRFWLEKGLEDKKQDAVFPESHKPVPYIIPCLCGREARHIAWNEDITLNDYMPLSENMNYFENVEDSNCGRPHYRNAGEVEIKKIPVPELKMVLKEDKEERFVDEDDDPYGLAHVSTSKLKAELRRRKRW